MSEQAKVIRKRIKSVSSTRKITRTMEMVAGAKLRVAQRLVANTGPYLDQLATLMREIGASGIDVTRWPHFEVRDGKKTLLLVFTSNRGLCGAFNANIWRLARKVYEEKTASGHEVKLFMAGRKGINASRYSGIAMERSYPDQFPEATMENAHFLGAEIVQPFIDREVDEVVVVYPHWISAGRQPPTALRLLPIAPEEETAEQSGMPPLFEPSAHEILDQLLPLYLRQQLFSILAESIASEHFSRRMAMKLATDNAEELVTNLTRKYNSARQAQITKELAEIIGGSEALE